MLRTTAGQYLINDALPEDLRDYNRVLDKKGIQTLYKRLAKEYADEYPKVSKRLADLGREASTESGGYSVGLKHFKKSEAGRRHEKEIREEVYKLLNDRSMSGDKLRDAIILATGKHQKQQIDDVYQEALAAKNPLAIQALSGSRGNQMNLSSLLGSDLLYNDHHDDVIPLPVLRSYSQGLSPIEYLAGTYGARKGVMATKFATQQAGFLSKQLNQIAHRLMVVAPDSEDDPYAGQRGMPVDTDDLDNSGALLAQDTGGYKRNTALTPKILKDLSRRGIGRLLVRSPTVGGTPEGGLYANDVGIRDDGLLPGRGTQIGLQSAQALSEPINQGQLNAKHVGGVANQDRAVSGFEAINQQVQIPKGFKGGAAHAEADGLVQRIEPAPAGGMFVSIGNKQHYVGLDDNGKQYELKVKRGDRVEAGDMISEGIPHWGTIAKHKGLGEGRRYFVNAFVDAMRSAGIKAHRRNAEVIARGLVNHVRLTDELGDGVPDDVVPYSMIEQTYEPREGFITTDPQRAMGKYLERPVLHHTIGTKIRQSMLKDFQQFGITNLDVHDDPPPFEPEPIRGMANLQHDHDWMVKMYGSNLKGSLLDSVHRGGTSDELGTSFVPGLARAVDFGRQGLVRPPEPGTKPQEPQDMAEKKMGPQTLDLKALAPPKRFGIGTAPPPAFKAANYEKTAADLIEAARRELGFDKQAMGPLDPTGSSGPHGSSATQQTPKQPQTSAPTAFRRPSAPPKPKTPTGPTWGSSQAAPSPQPQAPAASYDPSGQINYMQNAAQRSGMEPVRQNQYAPPPQPQSADPWAYVSQQAGYQPPQQPQYAQPEQGMSPPSWEGKPESELTQSEMVQRWMAQGGDDPSQGILSPLDPQQAGLPQEQPAPGLFSGIDWLGVGRRMPQYSSNAGTMLGAAADPIGTGIGYGAQKTIGGTYRGAQALGRVAGNTNILQKAAPTAANWLSGLGKARTGAQVAGEISPMLQAAPTATNAFTKTFPTAAAGLSRLASGRTAAQVAGVGGKAGGKLLAPLGGLMNVAWAPLEAGGKALTGDTEGAKKMFWDKDYQRSLGDTSKSYFSRSWDAADPRMFYNNALGLADASTPQGMLEVGNGTLQTGLNAIGMDATSRENRALKTEEGRKRITAQIRAKGDQIHNQELKDAIGRGHAQLQDGRPMPTQDWKSYWLERNPGANDTDAERAFLEATFRFQGHHDMQTPDGSYLDYNRPKSPDEMWESFLNRPDAQL